MRRLFDVDVYIRRGCENIDTCELFSSLPESNFGNQ
ncbi:hypothetical protein TNCT_557121, partial [Trichonephila clavata]